MPRVAENRPAAEPSSPDQWARRLRLLEAAAQLAAVNGLERVQMHEVARQARVAIGTLYRYFPSKTHLFVGVMADQVGRLGDTFAQRRPVAGLLSHEAAFGVLQQASRALLRRPELANAMLTSATNADAGKVPGVAAIDSGIRAVILDVIGLEHPTPEDLTRVRLLLQLWYGVLQSGLQGRISMPEVESDLRLGCRMLLAGMSPPAPAP
ncbi:TetR family transcriptional regulator [Streptomyces sp. NBC_01387]|uniref:TetR family transcriptional regulator n=1 Tax=unclassified Streptomyces TaxID=2593676 RepID=UPI003253738B